MDAILLQRTSFPEAIQSGAIRIEGDPQKFFQLLSLMDQFTPDFALIEPLEE
ncbi:alkyl sulfatase C-terminal domain-containing protein [Leclercia adecarboxylata]|uniref:alkyl sulfatase C-terminal domain-containing protein n=1 Tax=Leclercia adecarboxylata TaxID=83655 RepID=UPI0036F19F5F